MKKIWMMLSLICVLAVGSVYAAYIDRNRLVIGGIALHASPAYVTSVYGQPDDVKLIKPGSKGGGAVMRYYYGDSVTITFLDNRVCRVTTTKNNGWATVDGVTVGMDASALKRVYGSEYTINHIGSREYYEYYTSISGWTGISFEIKKDKIVSINTFQFID